MSADQPPLEKRHFATTRWTVVLAAGDPQSDRSRNALTRQAALARLCETYWYPLYAYVRKRVNSVDEAQDLTQAFFTRFLEQDFAATADPDRGRFRAFLLTACRHFLSKERDHARAQKRGGGQLPLSLDFASGESRYLTGPAETLTAEQLYERQWAIDLLNRVMQQLQEEMQEAGRNDSFDHLKGLLAGRADNATYAQAASLLDTTEAAARMAVHRMRKRYRELLRQEIAETVEHVSDVDDEVRRLFAVFT